MYTPSFSGCWAKVERAKFHRDALKEEIKLKFLSESNRPRFGAKFDEESGQHVLQVNYMPDFTEFFEDVSVILGDIVQNLRSSLDYLVFQLALANTDEAILSSPMRKRRVQFPVENTPERFEDRCTKSDGSGWIADLCPDQQAIIHRY